MTTISPKLYTIRDIPRPPDMAEDLSRVRAVSGPSTAWKRVSSVPARLNQEVFNMQDSIINETGDARYLRTIAGIKQL